MGLVLWGAGTLAAGYGWFFATARWHIDCPGAATASRQAAVCDSVGGAGGYLVLDLALAAAGLRSFWLVRRARSTPLRTRTAVLLIAALGVPPVLPVLALTALEAPSDYCTAEEALAERAAMEQLEAPRGNRRLPDPCLAYEGG